MGTQNTPNTARYRHQGRGLRDGGPGKLGLEEWGPGPAQVGGGGSTAGEGREHRQGAEVRDATSNRLRLLRAGSLTETSDTWKLATGIVA